jgi:3-oxoacyl-(acyl-carrier-protein) synthase
MNASILACGIVDEVGIAGTRGVTATWQDLEMQVPGTGKTMKVLFDKADPTFRRIDMLARSLVLACEAADLEALLTPAQRQEASICVESDLGALATDLNFASSLNDECVHAGIFPYSLTSTSLGEVALRYKLRGPTISMSVRDGDAGESLREALRMLNCGDCSHVVTGVVDTLREPAVGRPAIMRAIVAVLSADNPGSGLGTLSWPERSATNIDPFLQFAAMCR